MFFIPLPTGISAKTITKVQCFSAFSSTGLIWGESRGFEPLAPI